MQTDLLMIRGDALAFKPQVLHEGVVGGLEVKAELPRLVLRALRKQTCG